MKVGYVLLTGGLLALAACNNSNDSADGNSYTPASAPRIQYTVATAHPHDTASFIEGFEFYNNTVIESTGEYNKSKLRQIDLHTGNVLKEIDLPGKYFGEGISVVRDTVYQMTYQEHVVFMYDVKTFKKLGEFPLKTEGWGMTNDGTNLIVSDGSNNLYFYQPGTFRLLRTQPVTENGTPAVNINELEYINGFVYANQWQYNYILKINPENGEVVGKMDLTDIVNQVKAKEPWAKELNGIAYNPETKKFYVTGKNWSQIYELQVEL